jgi:hypothetical protein
MIKKQKYIMANHSDRSLDPFPIWLPKPPALVKIENFHKKQEARIFKKTTIPTDLTILERNVKNRLYKRAEETNTEKYSEQKFMVEMWKELRANIVKHAEIWKFIRQEQWRLKYGYWIIIEDTIRGLLLGIIDTLIIGLLMMSK